METRALVWTTPDAWIDNNYDPATTPKFDPATDAKAAYAIGVLIDPTVETDSSGNVTNVKPGTIYRCVW